MSYAIKQLNILRDVFKNKADIKVIITLFIFLLANVLKIVLFNFFIIPNQNFMAFEYKVEMTAFLAIIIYPVIFAAKNRTVFLLAYVLQTLYVLVNIAYYLYFHSYLHLLQWFKLFTEAFSAAGHSAVPLNMQLLIAFVDLPVFIYVFLNYFGVSDVRKKLRFFRNLMVVISLIAIIVIEFINYREQYSLVNFVASRFDGETKIVERYGTVVNNIVGMYLNRSDKEMINQFQYGKELSNSSEKADKPNFVIIQVESMDANVINQKYKGDYIAPYLHLLSQKNVYYPYVLSYHMGGGTSDSEFSIINSIEPIDGYPAIKIANYSYPNSFVRVLAENSYNNIAFHGNVGTFFNRDVAFPKMGFKKFFDMPGMNMNNVGWGAPDSDVFNYALEELKSEEEPFFSYVITMTSHGPFTNANNYYNNERYSDIKDSTVKNYFNSMSYVDQSINDFVNKVKSNFKNTYILIWGDHTPSISNNEYSQATIMVGKKYLEFVPLIVITPDGKTYMEDKKVASFLDISPTILKASGSKYDVKTDGQDLLQFGVKGNSIPFKGETFDREFLFKFFERRTENALSK